MPRKLSIDWSAARAVYVNDCSTTYKAIAERFRCSEATVRVRAHREKWASSRAERTELLLVRARQHSVHQTAGELARFNEVDLAVAKALRASACRHLQPANVGNLSCGDIARLAASVESAQRIAHQALGALISAPNMGTILFPDGDNLTLEHLTDEELIALQKLLHKAHAGGETIQWRWVQGYSLLPVMESHKKMGVFPL